MYWLFSLILAISVLIIFIYKRRTTKSSLLLDYEQRIKQLETNFQEVSQTAVESMEASTAELTELLDSSNLAITELRLEIQKAEQIIYKTRVSGENSGFSQTEVMVNQETDALPKAVESTTEFATILAKEKISEDIFAQEPKYQKISNLLAEAVPEQEIAKNLGVGYAEINLVKYLKQKT